MCLLPSFHTSSLPSQNENQLVQFTGNAYILSPYPIKSQSTSVILPTTSIESFSRVAPTSTSDNEITYGPYSNMDAYSNARVTIHYENNGPFLTVASLDRLIEISHWGNLAVEEHVHVQHTGNPLPTVSCSSVVRRGWFYSSLDPGVGYQCLYNGRLRHYTTVTYGLFCSCPPMPSGALLKGSYSRFDYQRIQNSGASSVRSYKTLLPAAAADVYYRDEIGNISTSNLRVDEEYVELELRPR